MQERSLRPSSGTAQSRCLRHRIVFLSSTSCLAANVTCRLTAHEQRVPPAGALCKVDCLRNSLYSTTCATAARRVLSFNWVNREDDEDNIQCRYVTSRCTHCSLIGPPGRRLLPLAISLGLVTQFARTRGSDRTLCPSSRTPCIADLSNSRQ